MEFQYLTWLYFVTLINYLSNYGAITIVMSLSSHIAKIPNCYVETTTLRISAIYREDLVLMFPPASSVVKEKITLLQESIHYII